MIDQPEIRQYEIVRSLPFELWLADLRDRMARDRIEMRIRRLRIGNFGDHKPVGDGVSELRVDHGPGYRIYYGVQKRSVVVLLAGGNKGTQSADIRLAQRLWKNWSES